MRFIFPVFALALLFSSCDGPDAPHRPAPATPRLVGGPCEGCEAVLEYGTAPLTATDTFPAFDEPGQKIKLSGTVYRSDGRTPAPDVVLYLYHTDQSGHYTAREGDTGWARRHGYRRLWVKTGPDGKYTFYTLQPGVYPDRAAAAHIHPTVLEPNGAYYYIESYLFEGDTLITEAERHPAAPRGGHSGIVSLTPEGDILAGTRDIILGRNIPGYE